MNYKQLKTLYKKEIMDVLRDKKTILTMVVLPIILYPLIFVVAMQVVTMISTSQQEQTYLIAYKNVDEQVVETLDEWIAGEDDGLEYVIKTVESDNPQKDLEEEVIDAYLTMKTKDNQQVFEIHYLSAMTNSNTVSTYLKEELDSYGVHVAEENAKKSGLDVEMILHPVTSSYQDHSSNESAVGSILGGIIPFLMITAILMGAMYPAIDATAGEKERGTLETLLTLPVGNMELIMSKFLSVATIAVVSVFINVLSMGGVAVYLYTTISFLLEGMGQFCLSGFLPAALISVVCVVAFALFMSAVVMCVCAFAKSFKEANNYVTPLTLVVMFTGYIGFIPNIQLDGKTALIPVANICLLMKNLLVFKYDIPIILIVLLSNVIYAFIAVWLLAKIYNSESILFGESATGIKLFERRKNIKYGSTPTIQEGLLILVVALLLMIYVGGILSLKKPMMGVIIPQLFLGVLPVLACIYIKGNPREIFGLKPLKLRYIAASVILYLGVGSLSLLISDVLAGLFPNQNEGLTMEYETILEGIPFFGGLLLMALLPAVCEELLFRGYLYTAFKKQCKPVFAMLWVSLLFAISHMSLIKIIPTAILGCALYYLREKSGSLFAGSLMHFLNNALAVFVLYYGEQVPFLVEDTFDGRLKLGMVLLTLIGIPVGWMLCRDGSGHKDQRKK